MKIAWFATCRIYATRHQNSPGTAIAGETNLIKCCLEQNISCLAHVAFHQVYASKYQKFNDNGLVCDMPNLCNTTPEQSGHGDCRRN